MWQQFLNLDNSLQAVIISAVVGLLAGVVGHWLAYLLGRFELRDKLRMEYEYSERKKLRELIGKYQGRILTAAELLNHRLWNLQENQAKGWLQVNGVYSNPDGNYFFTSTVYRTIHLFSLIRLFEKEAVFIDSRIAKDGELVFQNFTKALQWAMTDVELFAGLPYDVSQQRDHIFRDKLGLLCDSCINNGEVISIDNFHTLLLDSDNYKIQPLLQFFDGLCVSETRLRWDRIVALHLLILAFLNSTGYKVQYSKKQQFREIANTFNNRQVFLNLIQWLPKLDLDRETKFIARLNSSNFLEYLKLRLYSTSKIKS